MLVVVVAAMPRVEALLLLILQVHSTLHHVMEVWDGLRAISPKVFVHHLVLEAAVEAVDDVVVEDVGDGGVLLAFLSIIAKIVSPWQ